MFVCVAIIPCLCGDYSVCVCVCVCTSVYICVHVYVYIRVCVTIVSLCVMFFDVYNVCFNVLAHLPDNTCPIYF